MDDASMSQDPNAMTGADPMADPNAAAGADPTMADPTMGEPNADMGGVDDPLVQAVTQKAGDLSDKDKKTLLNYADSLKADDAVNDGGEDMAQQQQQPMMEQVIFTKKQLNIIKENFGPSQDELMDKTDKKELPKKQSSKVKNSPFSPPKFQ